MLFKMCFLQNAFEDGNKLAIINGNYAIPDDSPYSSKISELIRYMLVLDPDERPSVFDVLDKVSKMRGLYFLIITYSKAFLSLPFLKPFPSRNHRQHPSSPNPKKAKKREEIPQKIQKLLLCRQTPNPRLLISTQIRMGLRRWRIFNPYHYHHSYHHHSHHHHHPHHPTTSYFPYPFFEHSPSRTFNKFELGA